MKPTTPRVLTKQEWALLGSAYLSQFVAMSFFFVALVAILRHQNVPLSQLAWIYALGFVPALKFLCAPLVDRFGLGSRGHYGKWLALMQGLLLVTLLGLSHLEFVAGEPPLFGLILGCGAMAVLTAFQDMAADGLSCRILSEAQRGVGNALQMAGGMLGFAVGGGGVLLLYERWGWQVAMLSLALLNAVTLVQALSYREPSDALPEKDERLLNLWAYWRQLATFWQQKHTGWRWFLCLCGAQFGVAMVYGVLTPMLVDLGWSMGDIGRTVNVYGGIFGALSLWGVAYVLRGVKRFEALLRAFYVGLGSQMLAILAVGVALLWGDGVFWVGLGVVFYVVCYLPLSVLMSMFMMSRARASTPATDFSMQHGIFTAMTYVGSGVALSLAQMWGYLGVLIGALLCSGVMVWGLPRLWRYSQILLLRSVE